MSVHIGKFVRWVRDGFWKGGKWGRGGWVCCVLESYLTGMVGLLPEGCHTREVSFKNVQWAGVMLD